MDLNPIVAIYNAIRSQSLAAKEQRFKLYYWKVVTILVLIVFSIQTGDWLKSFDNVIKASLVACIIPFIVLLFDLKIRSRSHAIQRDGNLLKGLEDFIAQEQNIPQEILPERFYRSYSKRQENYFLRLNRAYERLVQYLVSLLSVIVGYFVYFKVLGKFDVTIFGIILLIFSSLISIYYLLLVIKTVASIVASVGEKHAEE